MRSQPDLHTDLPLNQKYDRQAPQGTIDAACVAQLDALLTSVQRLDARIQAVLEVKPGYGQF
jgi:hypothetical protein